MTLKEKLITALDLEKKGDWDKAHKIVQVIEHELAYWIHAYLHRKEPDVSNANYWYSRAGKPMPEYSFKKEWKEIYDFISTLKVEE